jgi:hypothetical protein
MEALMKLTSTLFFAAAIVTLGAGTGAFADLGPSHRAYDCGFWGPHHAEIDCPGGQHAVCGPDAAILGWCIARCRCDMDPPRAAPPAPVAVRDCAIPVRTNLGCGPAGVASTSDMGCATHCAAHSHGVCQDPNCDTASARWTSSVCSCQPGD